MKERTQTARALESLFSSWEPWTDRKSFCSLRGVRPESEAQSVCFHWAQCKGCPKQVKLELFGERSAHIEMNFSENSTFMLRYQETMAKDKSIEARLQLAYSAYC